MNILGGMPYANEPVLKIILYYGFSLFTVIVNLNLLIAIISDTYARVTMTMGATDARGKSSALREISGFK